MRADELGVDVIQNCEVKKIKTKNGKVHGVETTKGIIRAKRVGVVASGHAQVFWLKQQVCVYHFKVNHFKH